MIYFVSDLHLGHVNKRGSGIIQFERTCFDTIEQHDAAIKRRILNKIYESDELWVLGDIGYNLEWMLDIKGKKYLIMGNHDRYSKEYYSRLFDEVYDHPIWISPRIVLSHYPLKVDDDIINIHGHLHNSSLDLPNYINVNIHMLNYELFSYKQAEKILMKIPKDKKKYKFGYEWWAPHQVYRQDIPEEFKPPMNKRGYLKISEIKK